MTCSNAALNCAVTAQNENAFDGKNTAETLESLLTSCQGMKQTTRCIVVLFAIALLGILCSCFPREDFELANDATISQPGFAEAPISVAYQYAPFEGRYLDANLVRQAHPGWNFQNNTNWFPTQQDARAACDQQAACVALVQPRSESHACATISVSGGASDDGAKYLCPSVDASNDCKSAYQTNAWTWTKKFAK